VTAAFDRLVDAVRAEHAAIYGYGALGARLDQATVALATQAESAHRLRRDALLVRLIAAGVTPPPVEPAYALPAPLTDKASALRLAVLLEERTAVVWRAALPDTAGDDRKMALDALVDCAVRAARARATAGITPVTVPFPGRG
jgi:uncharacterized protein DUF4439